MAIGDHIIITYHPVQTIIFKCTFETRLWDFEYDIPIVNSEIEAHHEDTDQEGMLAASWQNYCVPLGKDIMDGQFECERANRKYWWNTFLRWKSSSKAAFQTLLQTLSLSLSIHLRTNKRFCSKDCVIAPMRDKMQTHQSWINAVQRHETITSIGRKYR